MISPVLTQPPTTGIYRKHNHQVLNIHVDSLTPFTDKTHKVFINDTTAFAENQKYDRVHFLSGAAAIHYDYEGVDFKEDGCIIHLGDLKR